LKDFKAALLLEFVGRIVFLFLRVDLRCVLEKKQGVSAYSEERPAKAFAVSVNDEEIALLDGPFDIGRME